MSETDTLNQLDIVPLEIARGKNVFWYPGSVNYDQGFLQCRFTKPLLWQKTRDLALKLAADRMSLLQSSAPVSSQQDDTTDVNDFLSDITATLRYMATQATRISQGPTLGFTIQPVSDLAELTNTNGVINVDGASVYRNAVFEGLLQGQIPLVQARILACRKSNAERGMVAGSIIPEALVLIHKVPQSVGLEKVAGVDVVGLNGNDVFMRTVERLARMLMVTQ